jgi:hypothetical protein
MMRQREKYWSIIECTMRPYPHEVADALELDYDLAWKITEELI